METPAKAILELYDLLNQRLDGPLSQAQQARLEQMLKDDPSLRQQYVNFFLLSSELRSCLSSPSPDLSGLHLNLDIPAPEAVQPEGIEPDPDRINTIRQKAEHQLQDFLEEQERQRAEQRRMQVRARRAHSWDLKAVANKTDAVLSLIGRGIVVLAVFAALTLSMVGLVQYIQSHRAVATLGEAVNARWSVPPQSPELHTGSMSLEQGYAELAFKNGARVILQAPCRFTLQSPSRMYLEEGTVTARVPRQAIGFTIDTRNSSVKDFGTEFGVVVDMQSNMEIHVFDGLVQLRSSGQARAGQNQWDLTKGRSARMDGHGNLDIGSIQDRPPLFVRALPGPHQIGVPGRRLDLADFVGGGNGLGTGIQDEGLDPSTGAMMGGQADIEGRATGYVATPSYEFIDGVFIPDTDNGAPIRISSTGFLFSGCPDTSGFCLHIIRNGTRLQQRPYDPHPGRLQGRTYGVPGSPAIEMHANAGITFDLHKIRSAHPGTQIERFRSLCGVSQTVADYSDGYWKGQRITVGFRVLVDGQVRFTRDLIAVPSESARIDIPLNETDRFLTLITTECHPDRPFAWSLFAEPVLELALEKP